MALTTSAAFPGAMVDPFSGAPSRPTTAPPARCARRPAPVDAANLLAVDGRSSCRRALRTDILSPYSAFGGVGEPFGLLSRIPTILQQAQLSTLRADFLETPNAFELSVDVPGAFVSFSLLLVVMLLVRCRRVDGGTHEA